MSERANIHVEAPTDTIRPGRGKKALGYATVGLCLLGGSAAYSVSHASTEDSFGPHEASYSLNTSGNVVADFGPLGTAEHTSEGLLPTAMNIFHLGATINVGEIPEYVPVGDASTGTVNLLSSDAQSYVQFFAHPEVTVSAVSTELLKDSALHTLLYTGLIGGGMSSAYLLLGARRRAELQKMIVKNRRTELTTLGLVGLGLTGCVSGSAVQAVDPLPTQNAIFNNTILEGTHITGRLGQIVEMYSSQVLEYLEKNDTYYGTINDNMASSLEYYSVPGGNPDDYITAVVVSDLHCNTGMADAIHTALVKTEAKLYLDGGDTVISGTEIEKYCINAFAAAVPEGVEKVVAPGNHDSVQTEEQEKDARYTVLNGEVVTIEGITILGDSDPYLNRIGQVVQSVTDETTEQLGDRLADTACNQTSPVNLLIVHRPDAATQSLESGCVNSAISGHIHQEIGPTTLLNGSIQYISGTTGGASEETPTISARLGRESTMSVWLVDKNTKTVSYTRTITTSINGTVTVSDWIDLRPSLMLTVEGAIE